MCLGLYSPFLIINYTPSNRWITRHLVLSTISANAPHNMCGAFAHYVLGYNTLIKGCKEGRIITLINTIP